MCPLCKAIFEKSNLKRHLSTVHEGKKDHKCDYCGKEYFEKKRLNHHIKREHDKIRDEKCNQCEKLFFSKELVQKHIRNFHKHFSCHLCDESFPTNAYLVEHSNMKHRKEVVHDATKDKVCSICGEEFFQVYGIFHAGK